MGIKKKKNSGKAKQYFFSFVKEFKKEFGGDLPMGKRKERRPLSTKEPIHLIIKSSGRSIFNPTDKGAMRIIQTHAKRFNIRLYDMALNWSHVHMALMLKSREDYNRFIRAVTSALANYFRKKNPNLKSILDLRPYTKILSWGRQFKNVLNYIIDNQLEAMGMIYKKKGKKIAKNSTRDSSKE